MRGGAERQLVPNKRGLDVVVATEVRPGAWARSQDVTTELPPCRWRGTARSSEVHVDPPMGLLAGSRSRSRRSMPQARCSLLAGGQVALLSSASAARSSLSRTMLAGGQVALDASGIEQTHAVLAGGQVALEVSIPKVQADCAPAAWARSRMPHVDAHGRLVTVV
jgi:hypothetical protein